MASARDKNSPANYALEQYSLQKAREYPIYTRYATPIETMWAGDGLIGGRMGARKLANNPEDIESFLFGIGANNLVEPKPQVVAELYGLRSMNIYKKDAVYMPKPLVIQPKQRLRLFS
jgi:hypothetical protein